MHTVIGDITLFFEQPRKFSLRLMTERNFTLGFMGYLCGSLSFIVWNYVGKGPISITELVFIFLASFCFNIFWGILFSAIINLFMDLTDSRGSATGTFIILGTADFAKILLVPFALIINAFMDANTLKPLIIFSVSILQIVFTVYLLKIGYKCSAFKALIGYIIPILTVMFVVFVFIISAIVGLLAAF